jgi:GTP-binding protein YchF
MKIGIVGLPYSGKTTLFEAITGAHGAAVEHGTATHEATVNVPDARIDLLAKSVNPKKVTYALVDFVDIRGVASDMKREEVVTVLSSLREVDGLAHVVRWFESPSASPHPRGTLDPRRDIAEIELELCFADLDIVERRMEKLHKQLLRGQEVEKAKRELALMERLKATLEAGKRIGGLNLTQEESATLRSYQFLSEKPVFYVLNVHEDALNAPETKAMAESLGPKTVVISARVEKEIAELDAAERAEFLQGLGIGEPAAKRVISAGYAAIGLRSFLTQGDPEVRAWTIRVGDTALTAAGKIHTDIARGFIRAEVTAWRDFEKHGSMKEAKNQGCQRLEGKEYVMEDGDIVLFRFKV